MHEYRVTKYDPAFRVDGRYTRDEWTSYSDVGRSFDGHTFTMDEYLQAEHRHIGFLTALVARECVNTLTITGLELQNAACPWQDGQTLTAEDLPDLLRRVLRNEIWCRLEAPGFFIHFGWDFYMYTGCTHTPEAITSLACEYELFAEAMRSPYRVDDGEPGSDLRPMTALYITRGDELLLLYRTGSRVVGNSYTGTAGGHMEPDEVNSARACILRELQEETGLMAQDLEGLTMRYVTLRLKSGEIRENFYFFASLKDEHRSVVSNEGCLKWRTFAEMEALPMPHTARQVLRHYAAVGRYTDLLYGGVSMADDAVFTPLTEF